MSQIAGQKRKVNYDEPASAARSQKRQKSKDARNIPSQTADMALSASGELNIASFVKAREFEINALEKSMTRSRQGLMSRAFQQVPRHMRRRTASHNVKKVPRRLRKRATREMKEDNTPTVNSRTRKPSSKLRLRLETAKTLKALNTKRKTIRQKKREAKPNALAKDTATTASVVRASRLRKSTLANPPQATSKFKRRQVKKTWLPTHLWHTKRSHMTRPTEPLWRMAIPLKPTEKSYRPTHRAAGSRGYVACDSSYLSTVSCHGTNAALESMLKSLGFTGESWTGIRYRKWKSGSRYAEGWVYERGGQKRSIAPVIIIWEHNHDSRPDKVTASLQTLADEDISKAPKNPESKKTKLDRRLIIRIHPSAFHEFWLELMKIAKMQRPQVLVEDLRFEIGSILVEGPGSTEALAGVLKPKHPASRVSQVWTSLAGLSNPSALPRNVLLDFDIVDPRFDHPPKQVKIARDESSDQRLSELMVSWPLDNEALPGSLFSHKARYLSSRSMLSQKAVNRRRAAKMPGQSIDSTSKDVGIPLMLLAHRTKGSTSMTQGSWEVLLPWSGVDAVWRSLMYYPSSSGNTPRFGGLNEIRQIAFEQSSPWFPGDFPGTNAGKAWDRTQTESRFDDWIRRPPSRRYAWDALDLGNGRKGELGRGWACDWEYMMTDTVDKLNSNKKPRLEEQPLAPARRATPKLLTQRQRKAYAARIEKRNVARRRNTSSPESEEADEELNLPKFSQASPANAKSMFHSTAETEASTVAYLATIRLTLLTKGTPNAAARIYRLPTAKSSSSTATHGAEPNDQGEPVSPSVENQHQTAPFNVPGISSPSLFSTKASPKLAPSQLRQRWLALDPNATMMSPNPHSSTSLPHYQEKTRVNRHRDPIVGGRNYRTESLEHIRVFPPNAPKEVKEMYGPPPLPKSYEQLMKDLMPVPNTIHGFPEDDESIWEQRHVPCPDPHDLIGFVTTGGYNLAQGRGTAIGAVWVQRIVAGWKEEAGEIEEGLKDNNTAKEQREDTKAKAKRASKVARQRDRERHLCIVRNAGESVGRLALWELC